MMMRSLMSDPNNSVGCTDRHMRHSRRARSSSGEAGGETPVEPALERAGEPGARGDWSPPQDGPAVAGVEQARRPHAQRRDAAAPRSQMGSDLPLEELAMAPRVHGGGRIERGAVAGRPDR